MFISERIQKEAAVRTIVARSGDEGLRKAADDRAGSMKRAMAAAKAKYPDGVPKDVRAKIFKDPAGWLASNSDSEPDPAK